jgi:tRNA G18 (ribose-2'-O)-methylase SpoU
MEPGVAPRLELVAVNVHITTLSDPRLDDYRNVPDPELLRTRGIFIAEGRHVVRRLLSSTRFRTRSLLLTPAAENSLHDILADSGDVPAFIVSQENMNAITGFNIHRGCLAVGERPPAATWEEATRGASRVVVLEQVSNADNVGGIFRNAAAFAADAVLLGPACTDPLYRKAIRTSMGAVLNVPFAMMTDWPADLARLRTAGFTLVALTPSGTDDLAQPFRAAKHRIALLFGHEGEGLSREALAASDLRARIPMAPGVDSLNVASAAAVALYLAREQGAGVREQ